MDEKLARKFAERAHGDQKYGNRPYVVHLEAVRAVLADFGIDGDLGVAAWLHDVLEDTDTTADELEMTFGVKVTQLVYAVTGVGKNRKERNECAHRRMREYPRGIILKLGDRTANGEASAVNNPRLLEMYRREYPEFKAHLEPLCKFDLGVDEAVLAAMWARLDKVLG